MVHFIFEIDQLYTWKCWRFKHWYGIWVTQFVFAFDSCFDWLLIVKWTCQKRQSLWNILVWWSIALFLFQDARTHNGVFNKARTSYWIDYLAFVIAICIYKRRHRNTRWRSSMERQRQSTISNTKQRASYWDSVQMKTSIRSLYRTFINEKTHVHGTF